jgi:GDPmannose 4,6-dehydratase
VRALITGVCGQDGSYLAEHLAASGHTVFGLVRGQPNAKRAWIERLVPGIKLVEGDLLDQSSLQRALAASEPDVVYNLGAITYVGMSWQQPTVMSEVTGLGVLRLLEAVREVNPRVRVVHASSSEMFGDAQESPQTETTRLAPRSPYGVAKCYAHHMVRNYRDSYGLFAATVIMFNHESPRRGTEFVTRKVTRAAARISQGQQRFLDLGNVDSRRDWGWAPEYMTALPLVAHHTEPDDFVVATGESHSVRELVAEAFSAVELDYRNHLRIRDNLYRPADVDHLQGDASKIRRTFGWQANVAFGQVVRLLVAHDLTTVVAA